MLSIRGEGISECITIKRTTETCQHTLDINLYNDVFLSGHASRQAPVVSFVCHGHVHDLKFAVAMVEVVSADWHTFTIIPRPR